MTDFVPRPGYFGLKDPSRCLNKDIRQQKLLKKTLLLNRLFMH